MTAPLYLIVRLGPNVLPILERYLSDDRISRSYWAKIEPGRELVGIVGDLEAQARQTGPQGRAASRAAKRALVRIGQAAKQHPDASVQRHESLIETWLAKMSPSEQRDMVSRRDRSPSGRKHVEEATSIKPKDDRATVREAIRAIDRLVREGRTVMQLGGFSAEEVAKMLSERLNQPAA